MSEYGYADDNDRFRTEAALQEHLRKKEKRKAFAIAFRLATEEACLDTIAAIAKKIGCGSYAVNTWLSGFMLPGGRHGPRVLEEFGVDSREYGGDWKRGFGGGRG